MEKLHTLIVGAGESGIPWAQQNPGVLTLDANLQLHYPDLYGDGFTLPFPNNYFSRVIADFIFNAATEPAKLNNTNKMLERHLENKLGVSTPFHLYTPLFYELIRVIHPSGTLEIIDLEMNLIIIEAQQRFRPYLIKPVEITPTDYQRSASLAYVSEKNIAVGKRLVTRKPKS